jgi:tetratricopeptide (TPR) repeat protein
MNTRFARLFAAAFALILTACADCAVLLAAGPRISSEPQIQGETRAWEGTIRLPTCAWEEDVNPQFWALETGAASSRTAGPIVYPYVMQDHLSRVKADHTYKALFLENEFLKVTCLPELGGRLHSVLDKSTGNEMFHLNRTVKPGMIAMRGAWISGGVEWNSGPHGHTVTAVSPVDAVAGREADGSAWLEISNEEQIFRTRWTVRVTLHPGRKYLDEQIRLENPTDTLRPYYFWNCTAMPNRRGTRFIFPMSLGTDHSAREFFHWPIHQGRDLSWLKNFPSPTSVFAVGCSHDFFGSYDVDADRGVIQAADHGELVGKKAWTWGESESGRTAERNLADEDTHYIEVQSGPLPTQSDYGGLEPHGRVAWQEWWYPVHGLGGGFEFATRDLAVQTVRQGGRLELRLMATARFPRATCVLRRPAGTTSPLPQAGDGVLLRQEIDLSPQAPAKITLAGAPTGPVEVAVSHEGHVLAAFRTPLPIPSVQPPDPKSFAEKADDQLGVEELYLTGRKFDRATDRPQARRYYELALARDPGHVASLRSLAELDLQAGLDAKASERLQRALHRDGDDGRCWFDLGICHLRQHRPDEALSCGYRVARCFGTASLGYDLAGRAAMQLGNRETAIVLFEKAVRAGSESHVATDHLMLAMHAAGRTPAASRIAERRVRENPTALIPAALLALRDEISLAQFARHARSFLGDADFEVLEASLTYAELGLVDEARRIVQAACVDAVRPAERSFLPLYYLAWYASLRGDVADSRRRLAEAAGTVRPRVFASRPEEIPVLQHAIMQNPSDAQAHLQMGCLLANLGRVPEAVAAWQKGADLNPKLSVAWRNLALAAASQNETAKAVEDYRKAIAAQPGDQTLYRDLAEILVANRKCRDAIGLLEAMPVVTTRREAITLLLAGCYFADQRYDECIKLLESTPHFVNWEGSDFTWRLFHRAHVERGRRRLEKDARAALADFEAALTYPVNLNVGRPAQPEEALAHYWRGRALATLGRANEARVAWQAGANGLPAAARSNDLVERSGIKLASVQDEYRRKCRDALSGEKSR